MRKLSTVIAALALAVAGLAVPATTAQADDVSPQGGCGWPGHTGYVYVYAHIHCGGYIGASLGNDPNWADGSGDFRGGANDVASSVVNAGFPGQDVVAFYLHADYRHADGYGCLALGEHYADWLGDNYYLESDTGQTNGISMNDSISSHRWVYFYDCGAGSWIT